MSQPSPRVVVVIPAYRPDTRLLELLQALEPARFPIVVVNDGSGEGFRPLFARCAALPGVDVVEHAINLGKGAALRTGFNHALCRFPGASGIVTADADGQHHPDDVRRVAGAFLDHSSKLVLGARQFRGDVPLRSRFGNQFTRGLFRLLHGANLRDTQTGLRGIPRSLAEAMLRSTAFGYEFELDMLIVARQLAIPVEQVDIRTLYLEGNASSHFNPLLDSMRIYFVLLRFSAASLLTAACDNAVFYFALGLWGSPLPAQICGRFFAAIVNFNINRRMVFLFRGAGARVVARYAAVVAGSGALSYFSLISVHSMFGISYFPAKLLVETLLFLANFALQRDFVFSARRATSGATDWTTYYQSVPFTARLTRKYTTRSILEALRKAGFGAHSKPVVAEFGGGNSCFLDAILSRFPVRAYHVVDTNRLGLDLLRRHNTPSLVLHQSDVRETRIPEPADLIFSVGLIEHFDPPGTSQVTAAHFDNTRPGGWVLISFPYPTWLYRATRGFLELIGQWRFPDERPLRREEVLAATASMGDLVWERTLWPLMLTQHMMLFRTKSGGA
jgi:glycosyltransferase involved in cell wall biosynthesis